MIVPVGHRVVVKPDPIETETDSGIVIVQDEKVANASQVVGTLVSAGETAWKAFGFQHTGEPWAAPGDRVVYSRYAGKFLIDPESDEEVLVLNDEDIVALVKKGATYVD